MGTNPYLSWRQRQRPPIDRAHARLGPSSGGIDRFQAMTLAPGMDSELARYPGDANDGGITRDRIPFYERDRFIPPGQSWVDWTNAGPRRPELHMRQMSYMREQGSSRSRFPTVADSPTGGLHTSVPSTTSRTVPRYVETPQMRATGQDRLAPGQYSGQTYSQTTRVLGGRR